MLEDCLTYFKMLAFSSSIFSSKVANFGSVVLGQIHERRNKYLEGIPTFLSEAHLSNVSFVFYPSHGLGIVAEFYSPLLTYYPLVSGIYMDILVYTIPKGYVGQR